jgi:predicted nucleotidyltransferase
MNHQEQDHGEHHDDDEHQRHNAQQRPTVEVRAATGGWPDPWLNVAELADVLPADRWTLVGGLMAQLHTVHRGLGVVRPTNDVDIVLHIETSRGVPLQTAAALESLGYKLRDAVDPRDNTAHRFVRGTSRVDLVAGEPEGAEEVVDVLRADHPAPKVVERLRGRDMVAIEGGTQALRRTINARLEIEPNKVTTISVPRPFGALILKAAAYRADSRDPDRHLYDAAALLACIEDPLAEQEGFTGSDRSRLATLESALPDDHLAWLSLRPRDRSQAQDALRLLCAT